MVPDERFLSEYRVSLLFECVYELFVERHWWKELQHDTLSTVEEFSHMLREDREFRHEELMASRT